MIATKEDEEIHIVPKDSLTLPHVEEGLVEVVSPTTPQHSNLPSL